LFKKILFCIPPTLIDPKKPLGILPEEPHPGIGYLSEFLTNNGIENYVIDMRLGYTLKKLMKKIKEINPDLIGITLMTLRHDIAIKIIEKIKSNFNCKIVVGGPHVSLFRKKVLEECKADFAIKHEGEYTLLELCQGKNLKNIKGLIYRNGNKIIENPDRPFIENLDTLPFPKYRKFELEKYPDVFTFKKNIMIKKSIPIITSRGCPFNCIYCPIKTVMGNKWRVRSAENVVEELKYWYKIGYRIFKFWDDNFTLDKKRVYKICNLIKKNNLVNLELSLPNGIRADRVDKRLLKKMKEVGFNHIAFGVEAGNNKILKIIRKGETIETIENAIKNACELGYSVGLFFMIGHPKETLSDIQDSINLALKYPVAFAVFYNIIVFPHTELYNLVKRKNWLIKDLNKNLTYSAHYDVSPFFETPELSLEERKKILEMTKNISKQIDKNYKKQRLEKTFGFLGKIIGKILYSNLYEQIPRIYQNETMRKIIIFLFEKSLIIFGR
jgi:radical SAM superfamily enzyme YgiQ (UPF0313 family)